MAGKVSSIAALINAASGELPGPGRCRVLLLYLRASAPAWPVVTAKAGPGPDPQAGRVIQWVPARPERAQARRLKA